MQVDSIPASTPIPEVEVPPTATPPPPQAVPPPEPVETANVTQPSTSEEGEQPTFHVMQPPPPAAPPVVSNEVPIAPAPPSTPSAYTQLIAVPVPADQPVAVATTPTTIKQTKRVCVITFAFLNVTLTNIF